jgi:hypothetical protein
VRSRGVAVLIISEFPHRRRQSSYSTQFILTPVNAPNNAKEAEKLFAEAEIFAANLISLSAIIRVFWIDICQFRNSIGAKFSFGGCGHFLIGYTP